MRVSLRDLDRLRVFCSQFSGMCQSGLVILLHGELGAGKTTFTRYLAKELGSDEDVSSPTFTLINRYDWGGRLVYHLDLYRLESGRDIDYLDLDSIFDHASKGALVLVEWPDRLSEQDMPSSYVRIDMAYDGDGRIFDLSAYGDVSAAFSSFSNSFSIL